MVIGYTEGSSCVEETDVFMYQYIGNDCSAAAISHIFTPALKIIRNICATPQYNIVLLY